MGREAPSSILVEDESAAEQDAGRDGNSEMSGEPTTEMPTDEESLETPAATLSEGENASIQHISLSTSCEASLDPPAEEAVCTSQPADAETRLEDVPKVQAGDVEEHASLGASQESHPGMDEGVRTETANAAVEDVTRVQATEDERDLYEHPRRDQESRLAVQDGGSVREHEATNHKSSDQSVDQSDPFAQNDDIPHEDIEMAEQQELGIEAAASGEDGNAGNAKKGALGSRGMTPRTL